MVINTNATRRKMLAATGSIGALALAGCLGSQGEDNYNWFVGTAGESTAVHGGTVGIATTINEHSDLLELNPRTTPGTTTNPRLLDDGEIDVAAGSDLNAWFANGGRPPIDDPPVTVTMCQTIPSHTIELFLVKRDIPELDHIQTIQDIEEDRPMTWAAPGSTGFDILRIGFDIAGLDHEDYNIQPMEYGELPDGFREERVDISIALTLTETVIPGYIQEMDATVDIDVVDWGFDANEVLSSEYPLGLAMRSDENFSADFSLNPFPALTSVYTTYFPEQAADDAVYEFVDVAMENHEEIRGYHSTVSRYGPEFAQEWMIQNNDVPIHPAAVDWYQENDLWDDNWPTLDDYVDPR